MNAPSTDLQALLTGALGDAFERRGGERVAIRGVCHDSRRVVPGDLFVAAPGTRTDGAAFIREAVARGAAAVLAQVDPGDAADGIAVVRVENARAALARVAAEFHGLADIQRRGDLKVIGVTGTNGKSTTAYMIRSILRAAGKPTALLGTIEYDLCSRVVRGDWTTPDPVELARGLVEAAAAGARHAVMEVSSHSLHQHRTDGVAFSAAVFTNLTQDHLDYHGTIDEYLRAKRRLFEQLPASAAAAVNVDDPAADAMLVGCRARVIRYGLAGKADLKGAIRSADLDGCRFGLNFSGRELEAFTPLAGRHNVYNALAAAAAAVSCGIEWDAILAGLARLQHVPGRLQRVEDAGLGAAAFVDYAHTDDALRNVLGALRPLTAGRLWCVFGCGGDRDRTKRPKMARAVAECADAFVITSDNPRTEDPLAIIAEIEAGLSPGDRRRGTVEPDRAAAIALAVGRLSPGDTLVIAGKGHEDYQIIGDRKVHFDDVEVARDAMARRRAEAR